MILSLFFVLLCVLSYGGSYASSYDFRLGNASLWHSEVAYCDPNYYMSRKFIGYTWDFVPTAHIEDKSRSTEGYIGYQPSLSTIFVVFRGSTDFNNWITNLDALTTSYPLCSGCDVHKGFYDAEQAVFSYILNEVKSLKWRFPDYNVICTGHSLGAALATLTAFDLIHNGIYSSLFTYGSPRVGNTNFANWASSGFIWITRSTHYKVSIDVANEQIQFIAD